MDRRQHPQGVRGVCHSRARCHHLSLQMGGFRVFINNQTYTDTMLSQQTTVDDTPVSEMLIDTVRLKAPREQCAQTLVGAP